MGLARWQPLGWPRAGGVGQQDAWLMGALVVLRQVHDAMIHETIERIRRQTSEARRREEQSRV